MLVNLTPHVISVYDDASDTPILMIQPTLPTARVTETCQPIGYVYGHDGQAVPLVRKQYSNTVNLPDLQPGTYYIVSVLLAQANPARHDLIVPADMVRDAAGQIVGCKSFALV